MTGRQGGFVGRGWAAGALASALAVGVLAFAASRHLDRACTVRDTPYLPLCADSPAEGAELRRELGDRIQRNPADSTAWTRLLAAADPAGVDRVLPGAAAVAPNHVNVLRWRAAKAFEAGKYPEGVSLLVQMLETRGSPEAAQGLASLVAAPNGVDLLRPHVQDAERWLPAVLAALPALKIPPSQALPLVAEAVEKGALPDAARHAYMRSLKSGGQWLDAYGLWLSYQKQVVPLLFNSGFDHAFEQDGFDWEFTPAPRSKAGVIIEQQAVARRGLVLEIDFTGRPFPSPVLRQYVFAPPGTYRLRGEYMGSKLRTEGGLAWSVVCTSGRKAVAARSSALRDTGGVWKMMDVEFTVPEDCGPVASLQLEPASAYEATTGMKGTVAFDNFGLTRSAN
jgi:hypothetical protein